MGEYIERDYLMADRVGNDPVRIAAKCAPAADVAPVRHGRWEYNPDAIDYNLGGWVCSICGVRNSNIGNTSNIQPLMFAGSKYCPHCGARMDLEETK